MNNRSVDVLVWEGQRPSYPRSGGRFHIINRLLISTCVTNFGVRSERRSMGNVRASWQERPPISVASLQSSSERGVQAATADPLGW